MPKFLFAYHGGKTPETAEAGAAAMEAWGKWFEGLGGAIVDAGNPVKVSHTVSPDGHTTTGGSNPVSGYGIFQFDGYEAACAAAALNPMVADGSGSVEVAEINEM